MMSSEDDDSQEARLFTSTDAMESLVLDQTPISHPFLSNSDYRSAMSASTPLDESNHPLASPPKHDLSQRSFRDSNRKSFQDSPNSSSSRRSLREADLVEPPSYADAIFTPHMGDASSMSENGREVGSSSSSSIPYSPTYTDTLVITVTQPQKSQEPGTSLVPGGSSYVTYLITTRTNIREYQGTEFSVRRRFRDVVTLADRLADAYRGYFIPPRPDKSIVESQVMQKAEFIEQRRLALEKYLSRLAAHPVLRRSNELRLFLQFQGKLPLTPNTDIASRMLDGAVNLPRQLFGESSSLIPPQEASQPAKGGRDLVRLFKELKQSVTNDWGGVKPAIVEEDRAFLEKKEKLQDLQKQLGDASQQAEALVKAQQEVGEVMGELGLAFIKIAKFETEEAATDAQRVHANNTKRVGTATIKASRFHREANVQSVKHLDQLHEYLGLMQALHAAYADRSNALLTVQTLMTDLEANKLKVEKLHQAASKFFGVDKNRERKIEELKEVVKVNEAARDSAQQEYDRIKERNRTELERLEKDRRKDFLNMIRGFVMTQVGYAEKISNVWASVVEESANGLSGKSLDTTSSGSSTPNCLGPVQWMIAGPRGI
ncbi:hypothetical protein R1sor_001273 [Riccia sorocarpa]|uniref:PX domain-containing protein n=1 Tax=Riccia sorocarpa TaxID=122646 RepID=A0ABD3GXG3_9MARC